MLFSDSNLVHRLVEIPQLQTDIIFALREFELVGNGDNFGPIPKVCKRCRLQAHDAASRKPVPGGKMGINFWLRKGLCFNCGRQTAYYYSSGY